MNEIISYGDVESKIMEIRGEKVLLDSDVAELYGVETKRVNEAVSRNPDKFPDGYIISLVAEEKHELVANCDRFNMLKHSTAFPTAFTEKGLYMLATILKSPVATQTTIAIVETFTKLRELSGVISQLPDVQSKDEKNRLLRRSGEILGNLLDSGTLEVLGNETSFELNLALVNIKHTVKRGKRKQGES